MAAAISEDVSSLLLVAHLAAMRPSSGWHAHAKVPQDIVHHDDSASFIPDNERRNECARVSITQGTNETGIARSSWLLLLRRARSPGARLVSWLLSNDDSRVEVINKFCRPGLPCKHRYALVITQRRAESPVLLERGPTVKCARVGLVGWLG